MSEATSSPRPASAGVVDHPDDVWVVGADGSDCAQHAATWAVNHAPGRVGTLRVATAWSVPVVPTLAPMAPTWDLQAIRNAAAAEADHAALVLRDGLGLEAEVQVDTVVGEGASASVLLEVADDAALLVLGTRGLGGFSRLLLGSTSTQCATHATVPTVIVPLDAPVEPARRVMVAFDGSENSLTALRWALEFAGADTVVDCVTIWDVTPIVVGADQFFFPEASDLARERFDHLVDGVLAEMQDRLDGRIPTVTRHFVEGRPRTELARVAEETDILVMGARGHGALGSAILGSVSTWLLHQVHRPMVVVPHAPD